MSRTRVVRGPAPRWWPAIGLAAVAVAVAGCGRTLPASANPVPRAAPGSATALSTVTEQPVYPVDRLRGSLLAAQDLGPGWTGGDPPVPDPSTPAPCGGPGTVARFPDAVRVGSTVNGPGTGFVVQEALSVYGDADVARDAFRASIAGLDCGRGELHGAPVTLVPDRELPADVGGDRASAWRAGSETVEAVLVLVQARAAVFTFAFVTPAGAAPAARPDPLALSRAAVARTLAA